MKNKPTIALVAEHHPADASSFGTANLIKTLCSAPHSPFQAVIATDMAGPRPVAGPWNNIPTLALFRPRTILPKMGLGLLDNFFFNRQLPRVSRFLQQQHIQRLFILLGNNARFALFAAQLPPHLPKDIYLIDDFVNDSHIYRVKKALAQTTLDSLMLTSQRVFTISPISAAELSVRYQRPCQLLPIPITETTLKAAETAPPLTQTGSPEAIVIHHAGTIHHLYADTIAQFIGLLKTITERLPLKITVEFWGNVTIEQLKKILGRDIALADDKVTLKVCGKSGNLIAEQRRADFLLLTNTFAPALKNQVKYSLSSKISEYLAAGKPILLYAPPYAALTAYLGQFGAAQIVSTAEPDRALAQLEQIFLAPTHQAVVQAALSLAKNHHSLDAFFSRITGKISV